jgi:hypothetical protein
MSPALKSLSSHILQVEVFSPDKISLANSDLNFKVFLIFGPFQDILQKLFERSSGKPIIVAGGALSIRLAKILCNFFAGDSLEKIPRKRDFRLFRIL